MAKVLLPMQSRAVSGKVVGVIHQAWRGLSVIRKFTMPTIRHTVIQMIQRNALTTLSRNWKSFLEPSERETWRKMKLVIKDLWGEPVYATGSNLYVKVNEPLLYAGKTLKTDAPVSAAMSSPVCSSLFDNTGNQVIVPKPTAGEVDESAPFFEIWVAGLSAFVSTIANVTLVTTVGILPSQAPQKNMFRRICSVTENSITDQTIRFRKSEAVDLDPGVHVCVIVIRYTQFGMKSVPVRVEGISVLHA